MANHRFLVSLLTETIDLNFAPIVEADAFWS